VLGRIEQCLGKLGRSDLRTEAALFKVMSACTDAQIFHELTAVLVEVLMGGLEQIAVDVPQGNPVTLGLISLKGLLAWERRVFFDKFSHSLCGRHCLQRKAQTRECTARPWTASVLLILQITASPHLSW